MPQGLESFFGGLLQGMGSSVLQQQELAAQKKRDEAANRRAILEAIPSISPYLTRDQVQELQKSIVVPAIQGLLPPPQTKGKKGVKGQAPDPYTHASSVVDSMLPPAGGKAAPQGAPSQPGAPTQHSASPSTGPIPSVGQPQQTQGAASQPPASTPPLPLDPSKMTMRELEAQEKSQAGIGAFETEQQFTTAENLRRQQQTFNERLNEGKQMGLAGTDLANYAAGRNVEGRPAQTSLAQQEGQAVDDLMKRVNPATGKPYTRDEAVKQIRGTTTKQSVEERELNDYLARNPKKGPLDFLTMKSNLSGSTVPLTPAAIEMLARQTRETGQIPSISWGKAGANLKAQIANKAAADAPTSDLATNAANYKSLTASLRQTQEQATKLNAFETVADRNLRLMLSKAGPISDTGSPWLNMTIRQLQLRGAGNPDVAAFVSAWRVASNEVSRVLNNFGGGGVLSDSARHETEQILNPNSTLAQLKASSNVLETDMRNRRAGFNEAIQATQSAISAIGQQMSPTGPVPSVSGDVSVQIPGHPPGTIPRSRLKDFQKRYPNAQVLQ